MPILFIRQDITRMETDAIVNAANSSLLGGGGVDGAIHQAAGPGLREYCAGLGGCEVGGAKITPGFRLKCKYIIHTVGPRWQGGNQREETLLRSCYRNSLRLAKENGCASIAFPMISTGVYGYPKTAAFRTALDETRAFLAEADEMLVYFVLFDRENYVLNREHLDQIRCYINDHYAEEHSDQHRRRPEEELQTAPQYLYDQDKSVCFEAAEIPDGLCRSLAPKRQNKQASVCRAPAPCAPLANQVPSAPRPMQEWNRNVPDNLKERLSHMGESFREMLLRKIDESGITDAMCYTRANQDRRLFNKIKNQPAYHPGKMTVLSFAIALELDLSETEELLRKAGYAFSNAEIADVIIRFYISRRDYDIYEINNTLYLYDQAQLGNGVA